VPPLVLSDKRKEEKRKGERKRQNRRLVCDEVYIGAQMTSPDGRLGASKQQSKMRNTSTKKRQQRKAFYVKSVSREKQFTHLLLAVDGGASPPIEGSPPPDPPEISVAPVSGREPNSPQSDPSSSLPRCISD